MISILQQVIQFRCTEVPLYKTSVTHCQLLAVTANDSYYGYSCNTMTCTVIYIAIETYSYMLSNYHIILTYRKHTHPVPTLLLANHTLSSIYIL